VTIVKVNTLVWETYGVNTAIDGHPATPANGGKRIFPGKKTYNDASAADRRKVYVKATITPVFNGAKVYFKMWDVDDPSSNSAPIDGTNPTAGPDNKGTGAGFEGQTTTNADTNAQGVAKPIMTVSMQPGDNFRVAASCNATVLAHVTQAEADSGNASKPKVVKITEMLTVWRKLHVELDSMAAVQGNVVAGNIPNPPVAAGNNWRATTNQTLLDNDMYEKGTLVKGGNFTVITGAGANNTAANNSWVVVTANPGQGAFASLTDDDTKTTPDYPDTGLLDDLFDDCYIDTVNDARGGTNNVQFDLNVGGATTTNGDLATAAARGSADDEANDWWVVYVLGAYQDGHDHDNDPDSENAHYGHAHSTNHQIGLIYLETIRDTAAEHSWNATILEKQVVGHEIGHQVLESGNHTANTIMSATLPVAAAQEKFSDADINTIRTKPSSPGT